MRRTVNIEELGKDWRERGFSFGPGTIKKSSEPVLYSIWNLGIA